MPLSNFLRPAIRRLGAILGRFARKVSNIAREEFENAIRALQERIDATQPAGLEPTPRPSIHHKREVGMRYKVPRTIDAALYDRIRGLEIKGRLAEHLTDCAFSSYLEDQAEFFELNRGKTGITKCVKALPSGRIILNQPQRSPCCILC